MRRPALLALLAFTAVFMATVPYYRGWFDLYVYYGTVDSWLHRGGRIYDYHLPGTPYGFTYPPFAALCMAPLTLIPRAAAVAAVLAANIAASAYTLRQLAPRRWPPAAVACLFVMLEPVRDTLSLGQVNLLLLALVLTDLRPHRLTGVGTGLAAAVKLTPALFIASLLLTRRWRAAATATGVGAAATAAGWLAAPGPSHTYWTHALWDTNRVGSLSYISNQSLRGVLSRLGDPGGPPLWAAGVLAILCLWARRIHRTHNDALTTTALTGTAACLISPVTWVHHLIWLLPALAVLLRHHRRRAATTYTILCSSVVWLWRDHPSGPTALIGANTYVWLTLWLLLTLPHHPPTPRHPPTPAPAGARPPRPPRPPRPQVRQQPEPATTRHHPEQRTPRDSSPPTPTPNCPPPKPRRTTRQHHRRITASDGPTD
ncbi:glycosyltransferase 87 family protein [Peterkaempfera sp. SMS 1(5)a]|uniref:glycosyltransferase 87 family protein n=1 Tax=Peterkaempfera podocarpi TaxID=3232308 RepID=UPI00366A96C9